MKHLMTKAWNACIHRVCNLYTKDRAASSVPTSPATSLRVRKHTPAGTESLLKGDFLGCKYAIRPHPGVNSANVICRPARLLTIGAKARDRQHQQRGVVRFLLLSHRFNLAHYRDRLALPDLHHPAHETQLGHFFFVRLLQLRQ